VADRGVFLDGSHQTRPAGFYAGFLFSLTSSSPSHDARPSTGDLGHSCRLDWLSACHVADAAAQEPHLRCPHIDKPSHTLLRAVLAWRQSRLSSFAISNRGLEALSRFLILRPRQPGRAADPHGRRPSLVSAMVGPAVPWPININTGWSDERLHGLILAARPFYYLIGAAYALSSLPQGPDLRRACPSQGCLQSGTSGDTWRRARRCGARAWLFVRFDGAKFLSPTRPQLPPRRDSSRFDPYSVRGRAER